MKLKLTTAQTVAFHAAESVLFSAIITLVVGIVQLLATSGVDYRTLGTTFGTLFVGSMTMVYKSLATNPQVAAGITDTVNEIRAAIQGDIQRLAQTLTGGVQPLAPAQLLQAPAQLDAGSVADAILQHLDLNSVAQGLAQELIKIRVPAAQVMPAMQPAQGVPQRPMVQQQPTYAPQQQPGRPG